jgi:hypothetical protein
MYIRTNNKINDGRVMESPIPNGNCLIKKL